MFFPRSGGGANGKAGEQAQKRREAAAPPAGAPTGGTGAGAGAAGGAGSAAGGGSPTGARREAGGASSAGDGAIPAGEPGGSTATGGAPAASEPGATSPDALIENVSWRKTKVFCGDEALLAGAAKAMPAGALAQGTLGETGKAVANLDPCTVSDGVVQGLFRAKDVGSLISEGWMAEFGGTLEAGGAKAAAENTLQVCRPMDFSLMGFTSRPVHAVENGYASLKPEFRGSLKGDEFEVTVKIKYEPGWRAFMVRVAGSWFHGWRKADGTYEYHDGSVWKAAGAVSDADIAETSLAGPSRKTVYYNTAPFPTPARYPDYSVSDTDIEKSRSECEAAWSNRFYVKRRGCTGATECCRWKIKLKVVFSTSESNPDYAIVFVGSPGGPGRSNVLAWFMREEYADGSVHDVRDNVHAHEMGHMLGAWDEYTGGASKPGGPITDDSLMGANLNPPKAHHLADVAELLRQRLRARDSLDWNLEVVGAA